MYLIRPTKAREVLYGNVVPRIRVFFSDAYYITFQNNLIGIHLMFVYIYLNMFCH